MGFHEMFIYYLVATFFICKIVATESETSVGNNDEVFVSPRCARVLLVGGGVMGTAATWTLSRTVLSIIGFTSTGVASGSFAAWWQSTMTKGIAAGSIFATLQSISMSGVGQTVLISSSIGGAIAANKIKYVCEQIDKVDTEEISSTVTSGFVQAEYYASQAQEKLQTTWESVSDMKEAVSENIDVDNIKGKMNSAMTQAHKFAEEVEEIIVPAWNSVKEMGESATVRVRNEVDNLKGKKVKDLLEFVPHVGNKAKEKIISSLNSEGTVDEIVTAKSKTIGDFLYEYVPEFGSKAKEKVDSAWTSALDYMQKVED